MSSYSLAWNRRRLENRRDPEASTWKLECVLLQRMLIEGKPALRIVSTLAAIFEHQLDDSAARDLFWSAARKKLGKLRRLTTRDIPAIEILIADRVPKPSPLPQAAE
jgi:hypothetical protein